MTTYRSLWLSACMLHSLPTCSSELGNQSRLQYVTIQYDFTAFGSNRRHCRPDFLQRDVLKGTLCASLLGRFCFRNFGDFAVFSPVLHTPPNGWWDVSPHINNCLCETIPGRAAELQPSGIMFVQVIALTNKNLFLLQGSSSFEEPLT